MRIIIAGGGIGGLSTALALRRAGIDFVVLEQAPELHAIGAGIQLSANCVRVLEWLGLKEAMARFGVLPHALEFREHDTGDVILRTPLGETARRRFGAPYYHAHRGDLQQALVGALGLERVRLGSRVIGYAQDEGDVAVHLEGSGTERGDALIGADGIHSAVRQAMLGPDRPRFTGLMALRGLVPVDRIADLNIERISGVWMGPHRSLVLYYVSGGRLMNWIGICPAKDDGGESWSAKGTREEALRQYEGWHPTVRALIAAADAPFRMTMYDRDPLPHWTEGRVTLLGDACHPMLPFHAQGAAMSIEDSWVLARCIEQGRGDIPAALRRYETIRAERANWVAGFSRDAERLFHMVEPEQRRRRNQRLRENRDRYEDGFPPNQIKLYGYDAEAAFTSADYAESAARSASPSTGKVSTSAR